MLSKNQIQFIKSLTHTKFRKQFRKFVVEGPKMLKELSDSNFSHHQIFGLHSWTKENKQLFDGSQNMTIVSSNELNRISGLKNPNQVLAIVEMPETDNPPFKIEDIVLMLDDISDPGNMGTIIRTADWFGIQHIICSEHCVDLYNPKVIQATMGSIFRVKVYYSDLKKYLSETNGKINVYGAVLDGENLYKSKLNNRCIIIIGNESKGISEELIPFISNKISIPKYLKTKSDSAESLNASIASAIICAEFRSQNK